MTESSFVSQQDVSDTGIHRARDSSLTTKEYIRKLLLSAEWLYYTFPSDIEDDKILELEILLNKMYYDAFRQNWPAEIQQAALSALGQVGEICYQIKKQPKKLKRNEKFFRTLKQFANHFEVLSYHLQSLSLPE